MEILEAFDLTRCAWSAAELVGCDHKTVARYVTLRDVGADPTAPPRRPREVDPFLAKVEELVDRSQGKIRADVVHNRLAAMGYDGSPRSTRRAVAELKAAWRAGHGRRYRPWTPEPGMWLQFDWGDGPKIAGRPTSLFWAWLAWSRYRVVIPCSDQTLGTLVACLDQTLRRNQHVIQSVRDARSDGGAGGAGPARQAGRQAGRQDYEYQLGWGVQSVPGVRAACWLSRSSSSTPTRAPSQRLGRRP